METIQKFMGEESMLINMIRSQILPRLLNEDGNPDGPITDELLHFDQSKIEDLYTYDDADQEFYFQYNQQSMSVRCQFQTHPGLTEFNASWDSEPFVELGINYAGKILILHTSIGEPLYISVPGVRSYDPAADSSSDQEILTDSQWSMIMSFTIAQIMAARYGAQREDVARIKELGIKVVKAYHKCEMLYMWMCEQIFMACYERVSPISYPDFMLKTLNAQLYQINMNQKGHNHTKEYLESYLRFRNEEMAQNSLIPPAQFFRSCLAKFKSEIKQELQEKPPVYKKFKSYTDDVQHIRPIMIKELAGKIPGMESPDRRGSNVSDLRQRVESMQKNYVSNCDAARKKYSN